MKKLEISPLIKLDPGTFAQGGFPLKFYWPWLVITNSDASPHVFTFSLKSIPGQPQETLPVQIASGETQSFPVAPFSYVTIDFNNGNCVHFYSPEEVNSNTTVNVSNLRFNSDGSLVVGGNNANLYQLTSAGGSALYVVEQDVGGNATFYPNVHPPSPFGITGILKGITLSVAAGVVAIVISGTSIPLGTATAAGQLFSVPPMPVLGTDTYTLTNATAILAVCAS